MRFSIVSAAHNEGAMLARTVESSLQSLGKSASDFEIVLADVASWDGSVEETAARFPEVRVVGHPKRRGTSPTKHLGAKNAQGDTLIFLDGHCQPQDGALVRLVEDVEQLEGEALVTPAVPALDVKRWENSSWQIGHGYRLTLETFDCGWLPLDELKPVRGRRTFYESPALNGCALAVSRDLYNSLGGFDADMLVWGVEDLDFGLRAWMLGHSILHDPGAVVGHRFRSTFDNYEVPYERLLVNQLRMARKSFTHSVWCDWVERCQRRHAGRRSDHPEGLWANVWLLFHERKASADAIRAQVQGGRVRDEFSYAERFGLAWPKIRSLQLSPGFVRPEAEQVAQQVQSSPSPSPSPSPAPGPKKRTILIFGYWPPTDIGVDHDRSAPKPPPLVPPAPVVFQNVSGHGMLWEWRNKTSYKDFELVVITPTFEKALGYQVVANEAQTALGYGAFWGRGAGALTVDYDYDKDDVSWGPNHTFRFPLRDGTGAIWRACAERLPADRLRYNTAVTGIDLDRHRATTSSGAEVEYDYLISTIPLDELIRRSGQSQFEATAERGLLYSSSHIFGIGLRGAPPEDLRSKCWIYFPEDDCPFYRVNVFSNYSPYNVPNIETHWSLMAEVSESRFKRVDRARLLGQVVDGLLATRSIERQEDIVLLLRGDDVPN